MEEDQRLLVLVASEDVDIYEAVTSALPVHDFCLVWLTDSREFLKRFYELLPDVVIIEDKMSLTGSIDLCRLLRQLVYVPLIIVSRDTDSLRLAGALERGADMYVDIASSRELEARAKALLRRRSPYWGTIRESVQAMRTGRGMASSFSPTEQNLLCFMLLSRYKRITSAQILGHVWAGKKVHTDTVRFYLRRLGSKLEQSTNWRIIGHQGTGYRLVIGPQYGLGLSRPHHA